MPAVDALSLPFQEAIDYLRGRLEISESEWAGIMRSATEAADTSMDAITDAMRKDMLSALLDIFEAGGTAQDFRRQYDDIAKRFGWTAPGGSGWHSRLIWRMETFSARAAGRWAQWLRLQRANPRLRHYFRYVTADDERVRPAHAEWHGIIMPVDHWFWRTHWPPNGFNCRCDVVIVTDRDFVRYGWTVTEDDDPRLTEPPDEGFSGNVGLDWQLLRDEASATATAVPTSAPGPTSERVQRLVDNLDVPPPGVATPVAKLPPNVVGRLGASDDNLLFSAATAGSHRHHPEAGPQEYWTVPQALLSTGTVLNDPTTPKHLRVVGEVGGKVWAAVIKVDAHGRVWLQSLHRSNRRQWRRWLKESDVLE